MALASPAFHIIAVKEPEKILTTSRIKKPLLGLLGLTAMFVTNLHQPNNHTVAEADAELARTQTNLENAMRLANSADQLAQQVGVTNSPVSRAIRSYGSNVIQKLAMENASAAVNVEIAHTVEDANSVVETYASVDRAEEALAALYLSGIEEVVIRPFEPSKSEGPRVSYRLLVPRDRLKLAGTILREARVSQIRSFDKPVLATKPVLMIRKKGIPATIRSLMNADGGPKSRRYVVYVLSTDKEATEAVLAGGTQSDQENSNNEPDGNL